MSDEPVSNASEGTPNANELASRLTPVQQSALQQLGAGSSMSEAARSAGVDRRTLYNWIHFDAHFGAAFSAWQRELLESGRARALTMTDKALTTVDAAIEKGNVSAALQIIRHLGVLRPATPGQTDPQRLSSQRELAARRRKVSQQEKIAELEEREKKLHKRQEARDPKYSVYAYTDLIKYMRQKREEAVLREAEKYKMTPDEIRKDYLEDEAEWIQETVREMARLHIGDDNAVTLENQDNSSPSSSPPVPDEDPAPADSPAIAKSQPTDIVSAQVKQIRKAPEPYVEPDDDPCVRFS